MLPPKSLRKHPLPLLASGVNEWSFSFLGLRQHNSNLCLCLHMEFVPMSSNLSLLTKTPVIELRGHPNPVCPHPDQYDLISTWLNLQDPVSMSQQKPEVRISTYLFLCGGGEVGWILQPTTVFSLPPSPKSLGFLVQWLDPRFGAQTPGFLSWLPLTSLVTLFIHAFNTHCVIMYHTLSWVLGHELVHKTVMANDFPELMVKWGLSYKNIQVL